MNEEINYIFDEGIIKRQQIAEKKMLEEYEKGEFTFETPLICLNPYLISPCSAVILFRTEKPVAIKLTVQGKTQETNIVHTFKAEISHVIPILGLYPDYENTVEISLYQGKSQTFQIITKPIERDVAKLIYMKSTANYLKNGELIFLSPALTDRATGFDANGDVRWHISIPTVFDIKRLKNGHILTGTERLIQIPYYMSGLYEMDLVGKIYKVYTLDGGYHHDQVEMPNGDLLVLTDDFATGTLEDVAVLLDRETGVVKKTWRAKDFLVPGMGKSGSWSDEDWFHCNAIWYDENTNSLTLSGRHMDIICNIDFESGELN
ncbi:MAG: aryl-sulfate sulfotransferase, partial [Eubacterium sp.]